MPGSAPLTWVQGAPTPMPRRRHALSRHLVEYGDD